MAHTVSLHYVLYQALYQVLYLQDQAKLGSIGSIMIEALNITVVGIVQGVGFRPFVYRIAKEHNIKGWVLNSVNGVSIHAEGSSENLDAFALALSSQYPVAAHVEEITLDEAEVHHDIDFVIRFSDESTAEKTTLVSPDLATCDECVKELFNPSDRRYRYPFINCTNCGPRFTIIKKLPYDRPHTSMSEFEMCPLCKEEYDNPIDRRFHAQPNACFDCGPQLGFVECASALQLSGYTCANKAGEKSSETLPNINQIMWAHNIAESDEFIARTIDIVRAGGIVAIKGLGGYHLACDATNEQALQTLRARKHREGKAFAVMLASIDEVTRYCFVNKAEEEQLISPARPIVLLKKRPEITLAKGLADDLPELGVMLPATPVQHLLMHDFGGMLVMTSGNIHDEPIVITEQEACSRLPLLADALLVNNRAIESRYDDSVVRVLLSDDCAAATSATHSDDGAVAKCACNDESDENSYILQIIRRARGFAPVPIALPHHGASAEGGSSNISGGENSATVGANADGNIETNATDRVAIDGANGIGSTANTDTTPVTVFATGPEQKNTFALTRGNEAFVSQHIGDVENATTFDAWLETKQTYSRLFRLEPSVIASDFHPEYLTSKWASEQNDKPLIKVQHHHAHVLSVMGENNLEGPVCGIAFDGTGYGLDGALWGGEVLLSNLHTFERFANFAYIPLPGGAAAIKHPLRCAYGALWAFDLLEHPAAQAFVSSFEEASLLNQMIEKGINTPMTSSVGRLFDAASALLGICTAPRYEGEAAILLEAALDARAKTQPLDQTYQISVIKNTATKTSTALDTSVVLLDPAPAFEALLNDIHRGELPAVCAKRFHDAFITAIVTVAELVRALYDISVVTLSGGVFMNRYLIERALVQLKNSGFTVAINRDLPPNDASISYGQAVLALHSESKE